MKAEIKDTTVLDDLLRGHSSELGNWCEIVSNHQNEPTSTTESLQSSLIDIDHNGPFFILASNLYVDFAAGSERATMDVYRFFGGHKNLYAVNLYQHPRLSALSNNPRCCMLMARNFESCLQVLRMDGKMWNGHSIKLEYVISSTANSQRPKTHQFTPAQLDAQISQYNEIHPPGVRQKLDPYGAAKPIDNSMLLRDLEKRLLEEASNKPESINKHEKQIPQPQQQPKIIKKHHPSYYNHKQLQSSSQPQHSDNNTTTVTTSESEKTVMSEKEHPKQQQPEPAAVEETPSTTTSNAVPNEGGGGGKKKGKNTKNKPSKRKNNPNQQRSSNNKYNALVDHTE